MMALPASQVSSTYWLPWYNNVDLDTQLRIANVSGSGSVMVRYLAGGNATDLSVARSASESMMITKDAAGDTAQHDQAFSPIAVDDGWHAIAAAPLDPFALDTMVTHIDLLNIA